MNQISSVYAISISNYVIWILVVAILIGVVFGTISHFCYKGCIRQITIVKLRSTPNQYINFSYTKFNKSNYVTMVHQTVDLYIDNRKHTRTLNCNPDIYKRLRVGKTYMALIRYNTIEKIL